MLNLNSFAWRKKIPNLLRRPILKALSHYPELQTTEIHFRFSKKAGNHIMKAQPTVGSFLSLSDEVSYNIFVSKSLELGDKSIPMNDLPEDVLVGWFGHELGHVMDYESRSKWSLIRFGLGYLFSPKFVKRAERRADEIAVQHGLRKEIIGTKNFILNHAEISERYKKKIRRLYLSPEQIMEVVEGETNIESLTS